jgi:hypothetical protein
MKYLSLCDCGKTYPGDMSVCPHCDMPEWGSTRAPVNPRDYGYDIETYPNAFTCRIIHIATDTRWRFEISSYRNDIVEFVNFILALRACKARGVGYNNVGFDYPVVHYIVNHNVSDPAQIYNFAMQLIKGDKDTKFGLMVWDDQRLFEQIDLIMIWHYNKENPITGTEPTSLKALEIAMRMDNVEDLPFPVGTVLTKDQIELLHQYNEHDVIATIRFYTRSLTQIKLREELTEKFGKNFMNMSNTKLGGEILITECEKAGIRFYDVVGRQRHKRQTIRPSIDLGECVFPYVSFEHPEFTRVLNFLKQQTITATKGKFEGLTLPVINGLEYGFAKGGMHASVTNRIFVSNDTHQILDVDVASFYPNLSIKNRLYAAHLGVEFCDAYYGVYQTRKSYGKGTAENQAYKEALNANYGNSNNDHSVFLDPKYTMSITVNGQLLLCMLVDQLIKVPGLEIIQVNTDGVTYYCPRQYIDHTRQIQRWWEQLTALELEEVPYKKMCVRDVNNYLAVTEKGKVKRIGAYAYERMDLNPGTREVPYGKDPSQLVVPMAAEAALVRGEDVRAFIMTHKDKYDFMCRAKAPRSNKMVMRWPEYDNTEIELPNIVRFYVSNVGGYLAKIAPPTGQHGSWKRAAKVSETLYRQVVTELTAEYAGEVIEYTPSRYDEYPAGHDDRSVAVSSYGEKWHIVVDGKRIEIDSTGLPHDPRIHTKNKSKHEIREMGVCVGFRTTNCSNVADFDWNTINYDYYVAEAEKLVKPLLGSI